MHTIRSLFQISDPCHAVVVLIESGHLACTSDIDLVNSFGYSWYPSLPFIVSFEVLAESEDQSYRISTFLYSRIFEAYPQSVGLKYGDHG